MNADKIVELFPSGVISAPPSKSMSHRAVICAGAAAGESKIDNVAFSRDIEATISCMENLGCKITRAARSLTIKGGLKESRAQVLNCGESGTTLRLLMPITSQLRNEISFTGQGRLMRRPLAPYLQVLAQHGVLSSWSENTLTLKGNLQHGSYELPGDISSQYVSGLLLALPLLRGNSEIQLTTPLQSASYVGLTLDMMEKFGVPVDNHGYEKFAITGGQAYRPAETTIEGDYSQAAFFLVAGALGRECEVRGLNKKSRQGDRKIINILENSGALIETTPEGGLIVHGRNLLPQVVDVSDIPDLVPPLAALFSFCEGTSRIINAARLRMKESDRLQAVTEALNSLGGRVRIEGDSLLINGVPALRGGEMESFNDHRIAMMGAVAAIRSESAVCVKNSNCVGKSYPEFWRDFEKTPREGLK
ncbi:MAG: 3-phosphoshikimate 1-carboxyvinyltransferase [Syntrophomonadaceae bacterium]|jgi:3-phosphoshikimate 1-carboxyvinyltransferase|nr:3-phosphoshikimate 1-carboxyvinyltransferase [Syntrophomonadaceae bacterium]